MQKIKSSFYLWFDLCQGRMVTEKFLGIAKVSMSAVFTTMGAGILIAIQLVSNGLAKQQNFYTAINLWFHRHRQYLMKF